MDNQEPQQASYSQVGFFSKFKFFLSKNMFPIILISILTGLSLGATGYLLMSNERLSLAANISQVVTVPSSAPTTMVTPTNLISPTPAVKLPSMSSVDPTASWSAFVSSKYAYSIKYPPKWTATITAQSDPKILEYIVFNPVATKAGTLSITLSYGTRSYLEALALDPQAGENIAVASVSATEKGSKDSNGDKAINVIVPFESNSIILNAKKTYEDFFRQILGTLRLTK